MLCDLKELTTVLHYFRSRGTQVDLIAPKKPSYPDFLGLQIPAVRETHIMHSRIVGYRRVPRLRPNERRSGIQRFCGAGREP
jgi:hypothetical protein